ncbi:uncharacterized protein LOC133178246 [Saccostrea echinata]|uniref:uncharacterized protein LOC133178246 n=1 Tax=Saccostrea echinata TaxID=191078 RepID=UPI002A80B1F5|nr:uncharacterized protein LOC133178246 [Saccostrea echinata]
MSVNYSYIISLLTIFLCTLISITIAFPLDELEVIETPDDWSIYKNQDNLIKRDCAGFPCMYTHMAEKAGRASLFRALARIIDDCAADPRCNPGRRKRSVLRMLRN